MTGLAHFLIVLGVVAAINVAPAFMPPTWSVLVFFRFTWGLPIVLLAVGGALAATAGRAVLAVGFRRFGTRLPPGRRRSLDVLAYGLGQTRKGFWGTVGFVLLSPFPSNAVFEAAGLAGLRLRPLLLAFFVGRVAAYTIYLVVASAARRRFEQVFADGVTSPQALAFQAVSMVLVLLVVLVDWPGVIDRFRGWWARLRGKQPPPSIMERFAPPATEMGPGSSR